MRKFIFYSGYMIALWGSVVSGVYFGYLIDDPEAAIACIGGCAIAGGLMMVEAFK